MAEPIIVRQHPDEGTRTPNKPCQWIAEATVGGTIYTARARSGAPNELARQLVAAGIPDAPLHVLSNRGPWVALRYRSFHQIAERTFIENAQTPVKNARYHPVDTDAQGGRTVDLCGGTPLAATIAHSEPVAA